MKIPRLRWIVALLLFFATTINYADRLTLSLVSTDMRHQFHMTEQDYGDVVTLFLIAYAIMYAASGYIVDRLGTRRGFAVFVFVWSVAAMGHGLATGKWSLAGWRFLLGLGEPGAWPAAAKAVAEWFPPRLRALGMGIFNAGSSVGSALAPPVVTWLTIRYGWPAAFYFTGALGLVWLAVWLFIYQPPDRNRWLRADEYAAMKVGIAPPQPAVAVGGTRVDFWRVVRRRESVTLIVARFFTDPVIYFVIFWLPEYLRKERGFNLEMVGKYAWVPFVFGGVGYLVGGWLSGALMRRGWTLPGARKLAMLMGVVMMPCAIAAPFVPAAWMAIAATCMVAMGHAFWVANLQTLPADLFPIRETGTVMGVSGCGGAIGGALANWGTGWVVAHFSYAPIFLLAGLMHPLSMALVHWMLPNRRFENAG
jgi:MFS transporter, ACS family, hexuronate transporter